MALVRTGLTVHLDLSSAISCDDEGGKEGVCGGCAETGTQQGRLQSPL